MIAAYAFCSTTGFAAPEIVVEEPVGTNLVDGAAALAYGSVNTGTSSAKTVTIRNTGSTNLTGLSVMRSGANPTEFALGSLGATSLAPGASTTFTLSFAPTGAGSRSAAIAIASNDPDENPFNITLSGTGVAPSAAEIVVEQPSGTNLVDGSASIVFGNATVGGGAGGVVRTVTVRNTGTGDLTGLALTKSGNSPGDFALGALGSTTLAPGGSTSFTVTFVPTAAGGRSAVLRIASNDSNENPFDITFNGTGIAAPEIVVEQPAGTGLVDGTASLAFGAATIGGVPSSQTVTIRNIGSANLSGLAVTRSGTNAADFAIGALGSTTLAPNATTTFTVNFVPSATGSRSATLAIASNDSNENPFDISLSGTGELSTEPEIVVEQPAGTSLSDGAAAIAFGNASTGSSVVRTVTIRNNGGVSLTELGVTKSGTNAAEFTVGALGATTLAPGASTTFTVSFAPTAAGARSATLDITSNDTDENPFDIALGGTGVAVPEIVVEEPAGTNLVDGTAELAFGNVNTGTSSVKTVTIRNTGTANLSGLVVTRGGTNPTDFALGTLGASSLAPGARTTFTITFRPTVTGSRSATLRIASNDSDESPFNITLSATGVIASAAEIVVEQPSGTNLVDGTASIVFGNSTVGGDSDGVTRTVRIRNTGTGNLNSLALTKAGNSPGDFVLETLETTRLLPGESTSFTVTFLPRAAGGRSAVLRIASNDSNENPFDIRLNGTGIAAPEIVVEQPAGTGLVDGTASVAFGNSTIGGGSSGRTVTIRNIGSANLTGLAVTRSGANAADFVVGALGATSLAPNASTTFVVSFLPTASGSRSAALQIASNDASENPFNISLGGTGVLSTEAEIALEEPVGTNLADGSAALAFGTANTGSSVVKTVTIRNRGGANLTGLGVIKSGTNAADFTVGALGSTTLAPGASTTFTVSFAPTAAGSRSAALDITSNDTDEDPFDIALGGTGVAVPEIVVEEPAGTSLVDGTAVLAFGDGNVGVASAVRTVTIRNTGTANLTGLSVTRSGTNPTDFALGSLAITSLVPGASTTFTLSFVPSATGPRSATLRIASNDSNENPFDISLTGTGVIASVPEIVVEQPEGTNLVDGTAAIAFGNSNLGSLGVTRTVTIRNDGSANLTGLAVTKSGTSPGDYVVGELASTSLIPGASMSFTVSFVPTTMGGRSALLRIASNDANENPFDIALSGTGVATPDIVVEQPAGTNLADGAELLFGDTTIGSGGLVKTVTIRNTGTAFMTGLAVTRSGTNAAEYTLGALGATTLAAGASTTFTVTFTPTEAGIRSATLQIASNDPDENPFDITLGGTGVVAPEIAVEQPAGTGLVDGTSILAFGSANTGTSVLKTVTIRNIGSADLTGLAVSRSGANAADFALGTLGSTTLAAGASTTFTVTFTPAAGGIRGAALQIASNDPNENPFDITLDGTGVSVPEIVVEEPVGTSLVDGSAVLAFGSVNVGDSVTKTVTIRNTGTANLSGLALTKSGTSPGDYTLGALGSTSLVPGASTTFTVRFDPTATGGRSAVLQIASNDSNENPFDMTLSGTGLAPEIAVEQPVGTGLVDGTAAVAFGNGNIGGVPVVRTVTIRNTGSASLAGLGVTLSGTHASEFVLGSLGSTTLAPATSTTFTVSFLPTATGSRSAALQIASNDSNENPFDITLGGTGVVPAAQEIVVEQPVGTNLVDGAAALAFGNTNIGSTSVRTVTLRNTGSTNLTGLAVTRSGTNAADFALGALGSTSLATGASTSFTVTFAPSAAGSRSALLQVASNDADENPFDITLDGTGIPVPEIAVEEPVGTNLVDGTASLAFGTANIGDSVVKTVTILNLGTANLTSLAVTRSGPHAAEFVLGTLGVSSLAPGSSTTFTVTFTPADTGSRTATLQIASNDADENPFDITLEGTGIPVPEIVVEEPVGTNLVDGTAAVAFGNGNIGGVPVVRTVTIRNTGTADLTGLAATRSGTNAADFELGTLGSTSLVPGASTTFTVRFMPSATGARSAVLQIASADSDENPFDITLGGTGVVPSAQEIVVEEPVGTNLVDGAAVLAFGNGNIGGLPVVRTVTIRNTGSTNLTGLAASRSGTNQADFALGSLGSTTLLPGSSTTFTVSFMPSAAGSRSAVLQIASNDTDENPFDITLGGTGVVPAAQEIVVEQPAGTNLVDGTAALAFGNGNIGGVPVVRTVTIRNTGSTSLTGLSVSKSGTNQADFTVGSLGSTSLALNASTTFTVSFMPSATGARSAAIQIASTDSDENPFDITLGGTGVVPATQEIVVEEPAGTNLVDGTSSIAYGAVTVATSSMRTVTIRNTGSANLTSLVLSKIGTHQADFVLGSLGSTTLASGASTTFTVTFTPAATGARTAELRIASNDSDENPFNIALSGTGQIVSPAFMTSVAIPNASNNPGGSPLDTTSGSTVDSAAAEITVIQGTGENRVLRDGNSTRDFGLVPLGTCSKAMEFSIRNDGKAALKDVKVTLTGSQTASFKLIQSPSPSVEPGKTTTFRVVYKPGTSGAHGAGLRISSNDTDENPFRVKLAGMGVE